MTTQEQEIVQVMAHLVRDGSAALAERHGEEALATAQEIQTALVPRLEADRLSATAWEEFQERPEQVKPMLESAVGMLLEADAALARRLDALLARYRQAKGESTRVDTGGGAYVGGSVTVSGGDFVGRDKLDVRGDGNVIGDYGRTTVINQPSADAEAIARAFADFYQAVARRPDLPPREKEDVQAELEEVEEELKKGEGANEGFIQRRLRNVQRMAPDIYDVVITTFSNPIAGLGMVAKKIAEKMKRDAGQSSAD